MTFNLQTLKKRAEFLRVRKGRYWAAPGLVLQADRVVRTHDKTRTETNDAKSNQRLTEIIQADRQDVARFGFTVTKKLGNAVVRNRIKRRLREAVRLIAPQKARKDYDYVLIGRKSTLKRPFSSLLNDLTIAFDKVHGNSGGNRKGRKPHRSGRPRTNK